MKPTKELIRTLTPAQRSGIDKVRSVEEFKPQWHAAIRLIGTLAAMEIVRLKRGHRDMYIIHPDWKLVDLQIEDRRRVPSVQPREHTPIPDPPKRFSGPPAVYSNISREERMDQILNSK